MVTRRAGKMAQKQSKQELMELTAIQLQEYCANEIAEFVRDNMAELEKHPMDYQNHFEYIKELYIKWLKEY